MRIRHLTPSPRQRRRASGASGHTRRGTLWSSCCFDECFRLPRAPDQLGCYPRRSAGGDVLAISRAVRRPAALPNVGHPRGNPCCRISSCRAKHRDWDEWAPI